jgi:hypothetical protein
LLKAENLLHVENIDTEEQVTDKKGRELAAVLRQPGFVDCRLRAHA